MHCELFGGLPPSCLRTVQTSAKGVTNGCADNMSGTSEVPQLPDPLCATRKSAEVGHGTKSLRDSPLRGVHEPR